MFQPYFPNNTCPNISTDSREWPFTDFHGFRGLPIFGLSGGSPTRTSDFRDFE